MVLTMDRMLFALHQASCLIWCHSRRFLDFLPVIELLTIF